MTQRCKICDSSVFQNKESDLGEGTKVIIQEDDLGDPLCSKCFSESDNCMNELLEQEISGEEQEEEQECRLY